MRINVAAMPLVGDVRSSTVQQARNDAFPPRGGCIHRHRRGAPGTGSMLEASPFAQEPQDVLRDRRRRAGLTRLGNPHGEHPLLVHRLTQRGVIGGHIDGQRVDDPSGGRRDPSDRLLHRVDQGLRITGNH